MVDDVKKPTEMAAWPTAIEKGEQITFWVFLVARGEGKTLKAQQTLEETGLVSQ